MVRRRTPLRVAAGDWVLIGRPGITMPWDWFFARVLWAEGDDIVTEHTPAGGERYRQVLDVGQVLAVGEFGRLLDYQRLAAAATRDRVALVRAREAALQSARKLVWDKLDEFGTAAPADLREHADD